MKALGVDCNTWSTDCIDGDEQVLIVNEYIETIKNPIIKDYLERRVAECEKEQNITRIEMVLGTSLSHLSSEIGLTQQTILHPMSTEISHQSIVSRVVSNNKVDPRFATNISIHDCGIDATTMKQFSQ